jgi:peptide/nickel transport system permease protein
MASWSMINSLVGGAILTALALVIALAAAFISVQASTRIVSSAVTVVEHVIESVPLLLWLLVVMAAIPEPRWLVEGIAFTLATFPITARLIGGEFERLLGEPFVSAARLLGMGSMRLMLLHLIPNARSIVLPLAVQLCGLAVAFNGAIGVVGFGNRSQLDLGTLLLRGKEYAFTEPRLLASGVAALVAVYVVLWLVSNPARSREWI